MNSQVVYGVLGLLKISAKPALFYIDEAEVVGVIDDWPIYQALSVSALFLDVVINQLKVRKRQMSTKKTRRSWSTSAASSFRPLSSFPTGSTWPTPARTVVFGGTKTWSSRSPRAGKLSLFRDMSDTTKPR